MKTKTMSGAGTRKPLHTSRYYAGKLAKENKKLQRAIESEKNNPTQSNKDEVFRLVQKITS
ncbi:MAG: hypothetical protein NUV54_02105 [Candidatus Taylorbacteria bacterium]|nr:hypothetical protein [Candidatus Taylorbacteria bacterium]